MNAVTLVSQLAIPIMLCVILIFGFKKKVPIYSTFLSGAEDGMKTVVQIFPAMLAILTAVAMFKASGAMDLLIFCVRPVTNLLHIPEDILPLSLLRPISGSGALGLLTELLGSAGPDSMTGRMASVIMGSTETTFYTLAVYFKSTKVQYTRGALPAALIGDLVGIIASVWICKLIFC